MLNVAVFMYGKDIYTKWPKICGHLCPHTFVFFWSVAVSWFEFGPLNPVQEILMLQHMVQSYFRQ